MKKTKMTITGGIAVVAGITLAIVLNPISALAVISANNLIAEYNLNGHLEDSTQNANDGTLFNGTGSAGFVTDANGTGVDLNGTGDFIDFGNSTIFDVGVNFSIEAWFKVDFGGNQLLFGKTNPTPVMALAPENQSGGRFNFYPGTDKFPSNPFTSRDLGAFRHLVGTYDGVTAILYEDTVAGTSLSMTDVPGVNTNPLRAGAYHDGSGAYDGVIYNLRLWNSTLTSGDVSLLFSSGESFTVSPVLPEPSTAMLLIVGAFAAGFHRRLRLNPGRKVRG